MKNLHVLALFAMVASVAACAPQGAREAASAAKPDQRRFATTPTPPRLIARSAADLAAARLAADNLTPENVSERRGLRMVEVSAIPYLRSSPEGARFLRGAAPRALARGEPAARCPAAATKVGAASRADAAEDVLTACLATLARRAPEANCACRVIALDSFLLDRREAYAFAPAVTAHLIPPDDDPAHLIAEAMPPEGDEARISLRDATREVGRIALKDDEAVLVLGAAPDRPFTGARTPFGYRRGRIAERLTLRDADGRRMSVLIGVERRDVVKR